MFLYLVSWEDYVYHYISGGIYKSKGFFSGHISATRLSTLLPSYNRSVLYNGIFLSISLFIEEEIAIANNLLEELFSIIESDFMVFFFILYLYRHFLIQRNLFLLDMFLLNMF